MIDFKEKSTLQLKEAIKALYDIDIEPEIWYSKRKDATFTTNVAMKISKQVGKSAWEVSNEICNYINSIKENQEFGNWFSS